MTHPTRTFTGYSISVGDDVSKAESEWYEDAAGDFRMKESGDEIAGYYATLPDGLIHVLWYSTTACGKVVKAGNIPPIDEALKPGAKPCENCGAALEGNGFKLNWPTA
jgi:hypothetical protein